MSHLHIDINIINIAKFDLAEKVERIAPLELYGMDKCDIRWGELIAKRLIINMFECTGGETLIQSEVDCLLGKLSENLAVNCC